MKAVSLILFYFFAALFGRINGGDFVGKVMLKYNVFTVIEGDSFSMECSARHEDRRPDLQWYFVNRNFVRYNLTGGSRSSKGNLAIYKYSKSKARLSDSGDYYCFAEVGKETEDQKTSAGIPIQVIEEENKPRVMITRSRVQSKTILTCKVYPQGNGFLTWRRDGYRVKYAKLASELEIDATSGGEYQCHGNLTLGGFKHFISTQYASGAQRGYHTKTQTIFLAAIVVWFLGIFNL